MYQLKSIGILLILPVIESAVGMILRHLCGSVPSTSSLLATGFGGTTQVELDVDKIVSMQARKDRLIRVKFLADTHAAMRWKFRPLQDEIWVHPGETALAFYTACNDTRQPVVGISTYNIVPFDAGLYFAKIQCFCFEEQILNPGEQVDMPVFFYIDSDFAEDPKMELVNEITLSYTFFESKDGAPPVQLPQPHLAKAPPPLEL